MLNKKVLPFISNKTNLLNTVLPTHGRQSNKSHASVHTPTDNTRGLDVSYRIRMIDEITYNGKTLYLRSHHAKTLMLNPLKRHGTINTMSYGFCVLLFSDLADKKQIVTSLKGMIKELNLLD